jgi:hypothetical protein
MKEKLSALEIGVGAELIEIAEVHEVKTRATRKAVMMFFINS